MDDQQQYERVTGDDNNDYYCPLGTARGHARPDAGSLGDCIEADVVGRYSGHLNIVR